MDGEGSGLIGKGHGEEGGRREGERRDGREGFARVLQRVGREGGREGRLLARDDGGCPREAKENYARHGGGWHGRSYEHPEGLPEVWAPAGLKCLGPLTFRAASGSATMTIGEGPRHQTNTFPCCFCHRSLWRWRPVSRMSRKFPVSHRGRGPGMRRSFQRIQGLKPATTT